MCIPVLTNYGALCHELYNVHGSQNTTKATNARLLENCQPSSQLFVTQDLYIRRHQGKHCLLKKPSKTKGTTLLNV